MPPKSCPPRRTRSRSGSGTWPRPERAATTRARHPARGSRTRPRRSAFGSWSGNPGCRGTRCRGGCPGTRPRHRAGASSPRGLRRGAPTLRLRADARSPRRARPHRPRSLPSSPRRARGGRGCRLCEGSEAIRAGRATRRARPRAQPGRKWPPPARPATRHFCVVVRTCGVLQSLLVLRAAGMAAENPPQNP